MKERTDPSSLQNSETMALLTHPLKDWATYSSFIFTEQTLFTRTPLWQSLNHYEIQVLRHLLERQEEGRSFLTYRELREYFLLHSVFARGTTMRTFQDSLGSLKDEKGLIVEAPLYKFVDLYIIVDYPPDVSDQALQPKIAALKRVVLKRVLEVSLVQYNAKDKQITFYTTEKALSSVERILFTDPYINRYKVQEVSARRGGEMEGVRRSLPVICLNPALSQKLYEVTPQLSTSVPLGLNPQCYQILESLKQIPSEAVTLADIESNLGQDAKLHLADLMSYGLIGRVRPTRLLHELEDKGITFDAFPKWLQALTVPHKKKKYSIKSGHQGFHYYLNKAHFLSHSQVLGH